MPANPGLPSIPSNFTVGDYIETVAGNDASCIADSDEAKIRFLCKDAHLSYNDPILYPGREGAAHLHHFFGNDATDHRSTYASLRLSGGGTCQGGPINRTGYWFPAMIKPAGPGFPVPKVVRPAYTQLYYNTAPTKILEHTSTDPALDHYSTKALSGFPRGLQMIFGWEHLHPMPSAFGCWFRTDTSGGSGYPYTNADYPGLYAPDLPTLAQDYGMDNISGAGYRDNIFARLISPACWDGVNLAPANGRSHLAWEIYDNATPQGVICPETHQYRIPQILVIVSWSHNGPSDFKNWHLSVDRHNGHNLPGGYGFHTDWFGAWDTGIQDSFEDIILGVGSDASSGQYFTSNSGVLCHNNWNLAMGDITTHNGLVSNGWGDWHLPEANRYLDIPAQPRQRRLRLNLSA